MIEKTTDVAEKEKKKFNISYLNKKEAIFLLGKLKYCECTGCPDFYEGCTGNLPNSEIAGMSDQQYLFIHTKGTERHLCGKLRNIVNLSMAEEQEIANNFENQFNNKISMLSRKGEKAVLIQDVDEFENIIGNIRSQLVKEFENRAVKINKSNQKTFEEMSQRLDYAESKIIEQDEIIKRLKRKKIIANE